MLAKLLEQDHRQQARSGPAAGDDVERRRSLADLLAIPAVNFSRMCWITFQDFVGMTSRSLDSRDPPQQAQAVGPGTIRRSRGRCSGNGLRDGRLRVNDATLVVLAAAISAASSSSVADASSSSNVSSS